MKVLTLTQPWATLVATGAKRVETRSWGTRYRGKLAIHAAKGFPREARQLCLTEPFWLALTGDGAALSLPDLPRGMVLGICELGDVQRIGYHIMPLHQTNEGHQRELAFGDHTPGRYAWFLDNVRSLDEPIPAKGALGLWEWFGVDELLRQGRAGGGS